MSELQQGEQLTPEQQLIVEVLYEIPPLSWAQYSAAVETARLATSKEVPQPVRKVVPPTAESEYPRWIIVTLLVVIVIVLFGLSVISTAKQLEAIGLFISPVTYEGYDFGRGLLIVSLMLVSEVTALLFQVAAAIWRVRVLTVFAVLFAGVALIANISVTARHLDTYTDVAAYAWYLTVLIPVSILGIGMILERLALGAIRERSARRAKQAEFDAQYEQDQESYRVTVDTIDTHPLYKTRYLPLSIYDALRRASQHNKALLEQYPQVTRYAQKREMQRYNTEYVEPESFPPVPQITVTAPSRAALPERVTVRASALPKRSRTNGKVCIYCNEPFEGKNEYCSKPSCKQKAYRARNKSNEK